MDFTAKRNALFSCLDDASKEIQGTSLDQTMWKAAANNPTNELVPIIRTKERNVKSKLSVLNGRESIFKRSQLPIRKCLMPRKMPDYQLNPHKWMKYSLRDVDISDHTNQSAAFAFLKEMDIRQDAESTAVYETNQNVEFKKSIKFKRRHEEIERQDLFDAEIDKPKLKDLKVIMPEYIVGQNRKSFKKSNAESKKPRATGGSLTLSHLEEDDFPEEY